MNIKGKDSNTNQRRHDQKTRFLGVEWMTKNESKNNFLGPVTRHSNRCGNYNRALRRIAPGHLHPPPATCMPPPSYVHLHPQLDHLAYPADSYVASWAIRVSPADRK
jgi:hypothetical protein